MGIDVKASTSKESFKVEGPKAPRYGTGVVPGSATNQCAHLHLKMASLVGEHRLEKSM